MFLSLSWRSKSSFRVWTIAYFFGMGALATVAALIGFLVYSEIHDLKAPEDDSGWVIFQLGFEHQRLLMAAEKGEGIDEIRLRGDIYLSRVLLVRDAPMLASVRGSMIGESLTALFKSAQLTDRLLAHIDSVGGRDALLRQLRADARLIRELMLDMSNLNRRIQAERRTSQSQAILFYLAALEVLLLALLALGVFVFRITRKLRKAGRELTMQLATQNAILRSVDAAILGLGPKGHVLYSNPRALALLGPRAASGAALLQPADEEHSLLGQIRSLLQEPNESRSDGLSGLRKVHIKSDGGTRHFVIRKFRSDLHRTVDIEDDAEDASVIVTVADVTVEEEAAIRRDEYDSRIAEASRLLAYAAISGGIVHEISQPLAAIRNYIYALKVSLNLRQGSDEHRAITDHLGEEVDRAIEVVRNVRRMGPQDPQDSGTCEIHEAIQHSVRLVTIGADPPPPITVNGLEGRAVVTGSLPLIGQVIVNLLKNALSASSAAGHSGAEVKVTLRDGSAEIAVADYGTGVSPDAAKTLFAPFSKSARGGMGLGLAICQRIAATLGGSLSWENREGSGAIFKFIVPLAKESSVP